MINYKQTLHLLGLPDQNMPIFREARVNRLKSIDKISTLMNIMPRLAPKIPQQLLLLDSEDHEWDDKMTYPVVEYPKFVQQGFIWGMTNFFFAYNWNRIIGNRRLRLLKPMFPLISSIMLYGIYHEYLY